MKVKELFPTLLGVDNNFKLAEEMLPVAISYLKYVEEAMFKLSKLKIIPFTDLKTRWGYKTTYGTHGIDSIRKFQTLEQTQILTQYIIELCKEFMLKYGYNNDACTRLYISDLFASEMTYREHHPVHTHPDSTISGVFYLQVPKGAPAIIIHDARPHHLFMHDPNVSFGNKFNDQVVILHPKAGDILLWNSWLPHEVPYVRQPYEGSRITIVFNVKLR